MTQNSFSRYVKAQFFPPSRDAALALVDVMPVWSIAGMAKNYTDGSTMWGAHLKTGIQKLFQKCISSNQSGIDG